MLWHAIVAWCAVESGDTDRSRAVLEAIPPEDIRDLDRNYMWWPVVAGLTHTATLLGDRNWSALLYDLVSPYAGRLCSVGSTSFAGAATYLLGALAATLGRTEEASEHFESALEQHRRLGARPFLALTQASYASALARSDPERAERLRDEALASARELGLAIVERRLATLG